MEEPGGRKKAGGRGRVEEGGRACKRAEKASGRTGRWSGRAGGLAAEGRAEEGGQAGEQEEEARRRAGGGGKRVGRRRRWKSRWKRDAVGPAEEAGERVDRGR